MRAPRVPAALSFTLFGLIAAIYLAPRTARCQEMLSETRRWQPKAAAPRWGTEIRLGIYRPQLTRSKAAEDVRDKMFDKNYFFAQHQFTFGLQFDWYPVGHLGLLGLYGRLDFFHQTGPTRQCQTNGTVVACTAATVTTASVKGTDTQTLNILPLSLGLIYRYEFLQRLLLSAKVGLDYNVWWATIGDGPSHVPSGKPAQGGGLSWSGAVTAAYKFDQSGQGGGARVNQQTTYVFLEYMYKSGSQLFPRDNKLRLDFGDPMRLTLGLYISFG